MSEFELSHELVRIYLGKKEPWFDRLLLRMNAAISRYAMVEKNEDILVGLSGGKDSLALLVMLAARSRTARRKEEPDSPRGALAACYVENRAFPLRRETLDALKGFCDVLCVPFSVREVNIDVGQGCYFCARARRRALAEEAAFRSFSRIALGHTQTDLVQTALLNLAQHGKLEGLEPVRRYFDDRFAVIRPLIFLDERDTRRIATRLKLPVQASACPLSGITKRAAADNALKAMRSIHPQALANIARAALDRKIT